MFSMTLTVVKSMYNVVSKTRIYNLLVSFLKSIFSHIYWVYMYLLKINTSNKYVRKQKGIPAILSRLIVHTWIEKYYKLKWDYWAVLPTNDFLCDWDVCNNLGYVH